MTADSYPKISIIIPVYNTEKYLGTCIESVLNQTYTNFELLLIDDGSTDTSGSICDTYAGKDTRITVYHRKNEGVSASRNFGLQLASGEYILFVDSDDLILPNYIEKLYDTIPKGRDNVISLCQVQLLKNGTYTERKEPLSDYQKGVSSLYDLYLEPLIIRTMQGSSCRVLCPAKMLTDNHISFVPCKIAEDLLFFMEVLSHCQEVRVCEEHLYVYRQFQTSSSHKAYITDYLPDRLLYMKKINEILQSISLEDAQYQWLIAYSFLIYRMLLYMNATAAPDPASEIRQIDVSPFGTHKVPKEMEKRFHQLLNKKHRVLNRMISYRLFPLVKIARKIKRG